MSERESFDYEADFEKTLEQEGGNMVLRLARRAEKYLGFRSNVILWSTSIILWGYLGIERLLAGQELERAQQEWVKEQFGFRVGSGLSRFMSDYVESINNEDKQRELYSKALEYYAEICEAYFSYPTELHYLDYALVHERVRKLDPSFES